MRSIRRVLAVMMVLCLLLAMAPITAYAAGMMDSGTCGDNAHWQIDWNGNLTISGSGATYDYYGAYQGMDTIPWFRYQKRIKTVTIEEGITKLGVELFASREGYPITSVTLPETLVSIGSGAFQNCDSLTQIRIPDSVTHIGSGAFSGCDNLCNITLGNSLTRIDSNAFSGCVALESIKLPETLVMLGESFHDCDSLREITIPSSVDVTSGFGGCDNLEIANISSVYIGGYAFSNCPKLHTVVLSENVTRIESCAFERCASLKEITIPEGVTDIKYAALRLCDALETVYFEGDAPKMAVGVFEGTTTTAYYPACNLTWTEEVRQNYGGSVTWVPYGKHDYETVVTPAICTAGGYTTYTCVGCGDSDVINEIPALGHVWSEGTCENPRTCTVCGTASGKHHGHIYDSNVDGSCAFCDVLRQDVETRQVVHMFRMYNPNTGEHFYTGSTEERDNLIGHGWKYEGVGFTFPANTGAPVYRLFHKPTGEHLYTMDKAEKEKLEAEGWNYEGIAFNSAYDTEAVQHRLHNPNETVGAYHFTFSEEEKQNLINAGWEYQGIGWYSCWK